MKHIYFIGIGGIGMSAIARYYNAKGFRVSGYDKTPSPLTHALESEGIDVHYEARALSVARDPPEGKEDASGSPTISDLPVSCIMTASPPTGSIKLSCFSAVRLVKGWNQWV